MSERGRIHEAKVVKSPIGRIAGPAGFEALGTLVQTARECILTHQVESTKREKLRVYEQTEVAKIKAAEAVLRGYFEQVFAERRSNFEALFGRLDRALEQEDGETINAVLRGILDIARTSPLADLGDLSQIRAALDDPNQVWDL
jgi:hypothetical protein